MNAEPELVQGVSPIFGAEKACFLRAGGHVRLPLPEDFGASLGAGFYLGLDFQPEGADEHTILGTGSAHGTAFVLKHNAGGAKRIVSLELRDESGRRLHASAQTTDFAAKRLLVSVDVEHDTVKFYEANVVRDAGLLPTSYQFRERPRQFSNFKSDLLLGGASIDGVRTGSLRAKVANLFLNHGPLPETRAEALLRASRNDIDTFNGPAIFPVAKSAERRRLFLDDVERLRSCATNSVLSRVETRDCSGILFRWLFDKHPLVQELCNELGIQLSFPGESEQRRNYHAIVAKSAPTLLLPMTLGKHSLLDYRWVSLKDFAADTAFIVNTHSVSVEAFVKFVRHKLGGGHFDEEDRMRWQKDVIAMTDYTKNDQNFMSHHMRQLTIAVLESVYENRIEVHATGSD